VTLTDEGLNGLHLHLINETAERMIGFVEVALLKEPAIFVARKEAPVELAPREQQHRNLDEFLGAFCDASYAYKFGPAQHDVAIATLFDENHRVISEAFHFIQRRESNILPSSIAATIDPAESSGYWLTLQSDRFLHSVRLTAEDYLPDDNYFHLVPLRKKVVKYRRVGQSSVPFRADVEALNLQTPITVSLPNNRE
jgi:beta-mannosidase